MPPTGSISSSQIPFHLLKKYIVAGVTVASIVLAVSTTVFATAAFSLCSDTFVERQARSKTVHRAEAVTFRPFTFRMLNAAFDELTCGDGATFFVHTIKVMPSTRIVCNLQAVPIECNATSAIFDALLQAAVGFVAT